MSHRYLTSHAEQKPELALLAINTLQKDCRDDDPMVRGLALRSLCSLRLANIVEYIMGSVRQGLVDASAYVRKTAVMGCAKLYALVPSVIKDSDLVDVLYNMLRDKDTQVICNALVALNEILRPEGGMAINKMIIVHLLSRIKDFSEWGQCTVIELVARYTPEGQDEMFEIMNVLEDRLRHSNSAVVLAATKVFLHYTRSLPRVHQSVYERLKAPLMTLMSTSSELSYSVLAHVALLVSRSPGTFNDEFKTFFCRFTDPSCVKSLKVDVLILLANESNQAAIVNELTEYVADVDPDLARQAIRAIAKVGIRLAAAVETSIASLLGLLELRVNYVTAHVCMMLKDILRKYPDRYEDVIPALEKCLRDVDESDGKAAVIWIIGEYGDLISSAPYLLEPLIASYSDETAASVRIELLSATMKLFFKRPPEVQKMLGRLFKVAIEDTSNVDVRDRALLYYRLLQHDVHEAARVVHGAKVIVDAFVDSDNVETKDRIFDEFNKLSVLYGMPADRFINLNLKSEEKSATEADGQGGDASETLVSSDSSSSASAPRSSVDATADAVDLLDMAPVHTANGASADLYAVTSVSVPASTASAAPPSSAQFDLFDLMGGAPASATAMTATLTLAANAAVDPPVFQSKWVALPVFSTPVFRIRNASLAPSVETLLAGASIKTMASGTVNGTTKLYSFAQDAASSKYFFLEIIINLATCATSVTLKAESSDMASAFERILTQSIQSALL
jgi:vesicle coat complex subunit